MTRPGSFAWIAALLLAAAIVSLAVVLRDVPSPLGSPPSPTAATRHSEPLVSGEEAGNPSSPSTVESRLETLSRGLVAARGAGGSARTADAQFLPFVLVLLGGIGLGAAGTRLVRRRPERAPQAEMSESETSPSRAEVSESETSPNRAGSPDLDGGDEDDDEDDDHDASSITAFEPHAVDLRHRGGLLPWSREASQAGVADPAVEERLRSLERSMLRLEQKLDELSDAATVAGNDGDEARLASFSRGLARVEWTAADAPEAPRPEASSDASRLQRAVRLLADDGWTEDRIADRLDLEPADVLGALPGSRRRRAS